MDGVDRLGVWMLLHHAADGAEHTMHGRSKVLAAVRCDQDQPRTRRPGQIGMCVIVSHRGSQGIDSGIARHVDLGAWLSLVQQVLLRLFGGREIILRYNVDCLAVELLGPGRVDVVRAQPRLNMTNRNAQVKTCECGGEGGCRVPVDKHNVRRSFFENRFHARKDVAGHIEERLAGLHDG